MEAFDTKHAGRELRGLIQDVIAHHIELNGGVAYGSKRAAARMLGLHERTVYAVIDGMDVRRPSIEKVCKRVGLSVDAFMADTSYPARRGAR